MGTIYEKLDYLNDTKEAIKLSIQSKGVAVVNNAPFRQYAELISSIKSADDALELSLQEKIVSPTGKPITVTPDDDYDALSKVFIPGDNNLIPQNITDGVIIYGVTGTAKTDGSGLKPIIITPTGSAIVKTPSGDCSGFSSVTVNGDSNLVPNNILNGVTIYGVTGSAVLDKANLHSITITPTGEAITKNPLAGYDGFSSVTVAGDKNLVPKNIAKGVTIYGVSGKCPGSSRYLPLEMSKEYHHYVDYAIENLYGDEYKNLMILEHDDYIVIGFLMDDFTVVTYNPDLNMFSAIGWYVCKYTISSGKWEFFDYTNEESPNNICLDDIVHTSCVIYYDNIMLFPVCFNTYVECASIDFTDLENGTFTQTLINGDVATYSVHYDNNNNPVSIVDHNGNITTIVGME